MKKRKKVLIVTDSSGMPRDNVLYEHTWISMIKSASVDCDFIIKEGRGITTDTLESKDYLEYYMPDFVILQLGIVDCSPRYFTRTQRMVLKRFPPFWSRLIILFYKKLRRRTQKKAYVQPLKFQKNLYNYFERCNEVGVKKIIIVLIAYPDAIMSLKNPDIFAAIENYNEVFIKVGETFPFVDIINPLRKENHNLKIYVEDGYHPNNTGNELVRNEVMAKLLSVL